MTYTTNRTDVKPKLTVRDLEAYMKREGFANYETEVFLKWLSDEWISIWLDLRWCDNPVEEIARHMEVYVAACVEENRLDGFILDLLGDFRIRYKEIAKGIMDACE